MTPEHGSPEWLAERRTYLGATDVVALLGMSPYKTPLQLWLEKTGRLEPEPAGPAALRGTRLEPYVAQMYSDATGEPVEKCVLQRHPRPGADHLAATPDYIRLSDRRLVEIKTHSPRLAGEYGPEGTDQVPAREIVQVMWQMHICDRLPSADLAVLFGVDDFRIYTIGYNHELAQFLERQADDWWRGYVVADEQPDAGAGDSETVTRLFPTSTERQVEATDGIETEIAALKGIRHELKALEAAEEKAKARIMAFMGDAGVLISSEGRFTFQTRKASPRWKDIATELGATAADIARHTPEVGPRVFMVPWRAERAGA